MNRDTMMEEVKKVFYEVFNDNDLAITEMTCAEDIEDWDSLTDITLITKLEDRFGFQFEMDDVDRMQNVGKMLDIIEKRMKT